MVEIMALNLPKRKIEYLLLGIVAGLITGIVIYFMVNSAIATAQGIKGAATNALNPAKLY